MTDKKDYKEGDLETLDERLEDAPITGFLVLMMPDGVVDVVPTVPGLTTQRPATAVDIRDMCMAISQETQAKIIIAQTTNGLTRAISNAVSGLGQIPGGALAGIIGGMMGSKPQQDSIHQTTATNTRQKGPVGRTPNFYTVKNEAE